ncbi:glycosyl hydrolase 115 family protein [Rhizomonospora bruguierae]|uniref:glycosyl hydrolase 115 family protein n=1 Tax=Rhizomonospora bruguierae TaxID=1581705 RepID=UPI001BCCC813|nr:glycosyl hydrolase 115 family protein [Micromonospora sp. NBRC 107566]
MPSKPVGLPVRGARLLAAALPLVIIGSAAPAGATPAAARPAHAPTDGLMGLVPEADRYLSTLPEPDRFPLVAGGRAATIVVSAADHPGVLRVVGDLQTDIEKVTGVQPAISVDTVPTTGEVVLVGTIGRSPLIDRLVSTGRLDVRGVAGRWETTIEQVIADPLPGLRRAFVIAGSDQRGTIYGAYDVSKQIGVSPYWFWDDVVPRHQDALYVLPGRHSQGTPAVRYRGFFINDENPALGRWAPRFFGPGLAPGYPDGFTSGFFARVFETMLRLKANYLWPAVWGRAFAEDDPANHATAKAYGVVMGTSHEAPMMRGIEEWNRHAVAAQRDAAGNITVPGHDPYGGTGEWSFRRNAEAIKAYWRDGVRRMADGDFAGVVTLGMRGNGDVSLPDGDGIELMQQIIAAQREILADQTGADLTSIPQVWTLYKEVQRYWDKGLRAPDDVTVVFTDDNWGNLRKLPDPSAPRRAGGYGMYYHFDYVGGGRSYKWVDTTQLPNTWDQLNQAYRYGVDRLWVVNVGDLKNEELPLQFFLDYAWDPAKLPLERLGDWERRYAAQNFGPERAAAIADLLHEYGTLQSRRKPELLNRKISVAPAKDITTDSSAVVYDDQANPFSLTNYREMDRVTARWQRLSARAQAVGRSLPAAAQDAYYQLVLYQIKATANLYALRQAEFTNILYAAQGRAATNDLAATAEARFADDQAMSDYYNTTLAGGKWKDFQTQPHIGYGDVTRYGPNAPWQQPELNNEALPDVIFPAVRRIEVPAAADLGVAIDGSRQWWPDAAAPDTPPPAVLPSFSPYQSQPGQYIEVFNRGATPFTYTIRAGQPWVRVSSAAGRVEKQIRASVSVDWQRAPRGITRVPITVTGAGRSVVVEAIVDNSLAGARVRGFVEANGYVSIEADHYTTAAGRAGVTWQRIPDIGRTGAGMAAIPVTTPSVTPGGNSPRLEYTVTTTRGGPVSITAYLSPRNPTLSPAGLRYAISVDDQAPQIVNITTATGANDTTMNRQWERNTSDNVNRTTTTHVLAGPGVHTIKFWLVDPTVVLQNLVLDTGGPAGSGVADSYLGPPESRRLG